MGLLFELGDSLQQVIKILRCADRIVALGIFVGRI